MPKEIIIKKNTDIKQELIKKDNNDDIISMISSSDSDISDIASTISISSSSEDSIDTFTLNFSSSSSDDLSKPSVYKKPSFKKKKVQEIALSAQCTVNSINKIKKNKIIKQPQEPTHIHDFPLEQQELYRHRLHHQCNKSIRNLLKNTDEQQIKEDSHTSQNINKMRDIPQEILQENNYKDVIESSIPYWKSILFPVSLREIAHDPWPITSSEGYDWPPFGKERRDELKMIENSMFYYQLKTNGYTHAWKELYTKINSQCNALGIPYRKRMALYLKEIEYLSLLLHDT